MATVATAAAAAAAAARHNAALLVPKVGFFLFLQLQNPRIGVSFCPWKGGERNGGRIVFQEMNFFS
jgi:hypothetical protein